MFAGATTRPPHPPYPLNRVRSPSFVCPASTSSERRASWRAVGLAGCRSVAGWAGKGKSGLKTLAKCPKVKPCYLVRKVLSRKYAKTPMKSAFLEPRERLPSSFGTLARLPSVGLGLECCFTLQEVVDHRFKLPGRNPLADSKQIAPSWHRSDTPGDEVSHHSDDSPGWTTLAIAPAPHLRHINVDKLCQRPFWPRVNPF